MEIAIKVKSNNTSTIKRYLWFFLQISVSSIAIWYSFRTIELTKLWEAFRSFTILGLCALLAFSMLSYVVAGFRLSFLLPGGKFRQYLLANLICVGTNTIFPAKAGEAIKAFYLSKKTRHPFSKCVGMVLWERLSDMSVLLAMAASILPAMGKSSLLVGGSVLLAGWVMLFFAKSKPALFYRAYSLFPMSISEKLRNVHQHSVSKMTIPWIAFLLFLAILYTFSGAFTVAVGLMSMAELPLTLYQALTVYVVMTFGMALPSTPGGLGVFEASLVLSLSWYGVSREEALGVALVLRILQLIPVGVAVGWLLLGKNRR